MKIQEWEPQSEPKEGVQYFMGVDFSTTSTTETFAYNICKKEGDVIVFIDCFILHNPRRPFTDNTYKYYKKVIKEFYSKFKEVIIASGAFTVGMSGLFNAKQKLEDKYKAKIGSKIIIAHDTLMVVDYSILKDNFTLSNKTEVSSVNFV